MESIDLRETNLENNMAKQLADNFEQALRAALVTEKLLQPVWDFMNCLAVLSPGDTQEIERLDGIIEALS